MSEDRRGVAYIRVSAIMGRDELLSPELQRHAIDTWAKREGVTIVHEIQDIDQPGRSFTKRRVGEVIQGIQDGRWRYVVLWKWSRWGRNLRESLIHLAQVEEVGGVVRAATEDFDPSTSMGRFTRDQLLLIAQLQSDMISDSWKETQAKRRRDGLPHTGARRWGYQYDRRIGYTPHPEEAPILRDAYERYVTGETLRSIAKDWNARGLRTVRGQRWTVTSLGRMLDTGFAAGLIREKSQPRTGEHKPGDTSNALWRFDVWREGAHEPVISRELWEEYKERRLKQALMAPRVRTAPHALSGLMFCGYEGCGAAMVMRYSMYHGKTYLNWTCHRAKERDEHPPNNISDRRAQAEVLAWIERHAEGGEDVTEQARRMAAAQEATGDIERYEAEISRLKTKRARLADALTDGLVEREDYLRQRDEIADALQAAEEGLKAVRARERAAGASVVREFTTLRQEWPRLSPHTQREALMTVLRRIVVLPGPYVPGRKLQLIPAWEE